MSERRPKVGKTESPKENKKSKVGSPKEDVYNSPVSAKGRDFHSNYSLTLKKMEYEKSY